MTLLEQEARLKQQQTIRLKPEKPGDVGTHNVPGLRGYRVLRIAHREQFVFSTLSQFVLELLAAVHVGTIGLRSSGPGPAATAT
jgi:hypothetical protein